MNKLLTILRDLTYHSWPDDPSVLLKVSLITVKFSLRSDGALNNTSCLVHLSLFVTQSHSLIMFFFCVTQ